VQAPERAEATDRHGDQAGHARHDAWVNQDAPPGHFADLDERRLVVAPAPTEPQVTNVTPASAACVAVGDDERVAGRLLAQPALGLVVEDDGEFVHHAIMARAAQ